jgi:hypothetical protein
MTVIIIGVVTHMADVSTPEFQKLRSDLTESLRLGNTKTAYNSILMPILLWKV